MQNCDHVVKPSCSQWHNATCVFHLSSHIRPLRNVLHFAPHHICTLDHPQPPGLRLPVARCLSPVWKWFRRSPKAAELREPQPAGFSQVRGQQSVPGACALCQPWGHWGMAGENLHSADRQVRSNVCSYFGWKCVAEPMKRLPAQCVWPLRAWYRGKQHGLHSTTLLLWRGWEHCRLEDPQSDLQIWQISFWFGSQLHQINPVIQTYRVEGFWHIQLHAPVMRYNVCIRSWDGKI